MPAEADMPAISPLERLIELFASGTVPTCVGPPVDVDVTSEYKVSVPEEMVDVPTPFP